METANSNGEIKMKRTMLVHMRTEYDQGAFEKHLETNGIEYAHALSYELEYWRMQNNDYVVVEVEGEKGQDDMENLALEYGVRRVYIIEEGRLFERDLFWYSTTLIGQLEQVKNRWEFEKEEQSLHIFNKDYRIV